MAITTGRIQALLNCPTTTCWLCQAARPARSIQICPASRLPSPSASGGFADISPAKPAEIKFLSEPVPHRADNRGSRRFDRPQKGRRKISTSCGNQRPFPPPHADFGTGTSRWHPRHTRQRREGSRKWITTSSSSTFFPAASAISPLRRGPGARIFTMTAGQVGATSALGRTPGQRRRDDGGLGGRNRRSRSLYKAGRADGRMRGLWVVHGADWAPAC